VQQDAWSAARRDVATLVGEPDPASGPRPTRRPGRYLYDPNPAVTRAGLVGRLAAELDAEQIDPHIAFLTADRVRATPFARSLEILAELPFDVRALARMLAVLGATSVDIRRRGLAGDVESLRRRILPSRRGERGAHRPMTVVMTRVAEAPWAFVCVDCLDPVDQARPTATGVGGTATAGAAGAGVTAGGDGSGTR
jgi:hypothetical protein